MQQGAFPASIVVIELPDPEPLEAAEDAEATPDPATATSGCETERAAVGSEPLSTCPAVDDGGKGAGELQTKNGGQSLGAGESAECAGSFISTDSEDASESCILIGPSRPQQS